MMFPMCGISLNIITQPTSHNKQQQQIRGVPQSTEPSIFYRPERSPLPERHSCKTDKLDRAPSHA